MRSPLCLAAAASIALSGCGGGTDPTDVPVLTMENLAGIYYGATFTTEEGGVVTDQLWLGATIDLTLYAQGTTDGRLYMPPDSTGCCGLDISLGGTWALEGNTVTLTQASDNFFNGMALVFEHTHLTGSVTRDNVTYRVVLAL